MNSELTNLYSEILLEHSKEPSNFKKLQIVSNHAHGVNPLCGDTVDVYLLIEEGKIKEISFQGKGCAICMASSSMMTECIKGLTLKEAESLFADFRDYMQGHQQELGVDLESFEALAGVKKFPMRVKCATLPWHVLNAALNNQENKITLECSG